MLLSIFFIHDMHTERTWFQVLQQDAGSTWVMKLLLGDNGNYLW